MLDREFLGQGEAAAYAEGFAGDFQAWRGLFAFVFVLIYAESDGADKIQRKIIVVGDFFGAADVFYVGFQDAVEDVRSREGCPGRFGWGAVRRRGLWRWSLGG